MLISVTASFEFAATVLLSITKPVGCDAEERPLSTINNRLTVNTNAVLESCDLKIVLFMSTPFSVLIENCFFDFRSKSLLRTTQRRIDDRKISPADQIIHIGDAQHPLQLFCGYLHRPCGGRCTWSWLRKRRRHSRVV